MDMRVRAARRQRIGAAVRWVAACVAVVVAACTTEPMIQAAGDGCMASCSQRSPDGQSCAHWSAFVSETCVAHHSAAASCCAIGDRAMCAVAAAPLATGSPCVCRGADAQGAYVVQGYACTTH